jgi:hypothetical protein
VSNQVDAMARLEAMEAERIVVPVQGAPDVAEKRTQGPQTYTVLVERELGTIIRNGESATVGDFVKAWVDVATVTVPPRTARKTVVTKGLMQAGITPDPGQPAPRVRVLDADSAFVHEPEAKQPPAKWVIG